MILRQTNEELHPTLAWIKSHMGKYLVLKTLYINDSSLTCNLHPCLAKRAKLNCFNCLKSIPPCDLGRQFLPTNPCHFTLLLTKRVRNLETTHRVGWYSLGQGFYQNFFSISRSNLSFHFANFLANFSLISLNVLFLFFPTKDVKPKYFLCCLMT